MKHYETVSIPAREVRKHCKTTCDFCQKSIDEESYQVNTVEIERSIGTSYPEGGSGTRYIVDMCGKCWDSQFIPWLKEKGIAPETEEWDF